MRPVLFELGVFRLHSYGVLIAMGGVLSFLFWLRKRETMGLKKEEDIWLLFNVILFSGFLGGRLLFLFEYLKPFSPEFWEVAFSFSRGFSVLGAFLGVSVGIYWYCWYLGIEFLRVLDYVCQAAPFWHFFGRLGCFAAGCCYGREPRGDLPWAVTFADPRSQVAPALLGRPLHPAQLYEALGDLAIAAALYLLVLPRIERGSLRPGSLAAAYFAFYAVLRFATEYYRGDTLPAPILPLTAAQGLSLLMLAFAVSLLASVNRKKCIPS